MSTAHAVSHAAEDTESSASLVRNVCLQYLATSQNPDGGWGYHPGSESSVEASGWALMALARESDAPEPGEDLEEAKARGFGWLSRAQLPGGSWPAFMGLRQGCWATALACLALRAHAESTDRVARGLEWLVNTWPAEGSLWRRLQRRLSRQSSVVRQNSSLKGWGWTPGTSSWVEPTAYALLLLSGVPEALHPPGTSKRIRLAESMLYDRMCPGGGWNSGNPLVYGVAGVPRVGPTVWALLALRHCATRPENHMSLSWLENNYSAIRGPASLALAHLCLASCGRRVRPLGPALQKLYRENQFLQSVLVFAWVAIALSGKPPWATCNFGF